MDFIFMILRLFATLTIIIVLMIIVLKYSKKGIDSTTRRSYTKIVDKTQISKDSFIVVLRVGKEGMVLLTSIGHTEKLKDLSEEEINKAEADKQEAFKDMTKAYDKFIDISKYKVQAAIGKIKSKEEKHEK
jgi:flagellar protein FliO/FliZ